MSRHTLSVLVEDKPGVLARVSSLFSRRGFNIESLAVGPPRCPDISRMTIVVNVDGPAARAGHQAAQQADQRAQDRRARPRRRRSQREIMLVKVKADLDTRSHILETVELFRAKVVDVAPDTRHDRGDRQVRQAEALLKVLEPFGIKELVKSGMVAVGRGPRSITDRSLRPRVDRSA